MAAFASNREFRVSNLMFFKPNQQYFGHSDWNWRHIVVSWVSICLSKLRLITTIFIFLNCKKYGFFFFVLFLVILSFYLRLNECYQYIVFGGDTFRDCARSMYCQSIFRNHFFLSISLSFFFRSTIEFYYYYYYFSNVIIFPLPARIMLSSRCERSGLYFHVKWYLSMY